MLCCCCTSLEYVRVYNAGNAAGIGGRGYVHSCDYSYCTLSDDSGGEPSWDDPNDNISIPPPPSPCPPPPGCACPSKQVLRVYSALKGSLLAERGRPHGRGQRNGSDGRGYPRVLHPGCGSSTLGVVLQRDHGCEVVNTDFSEVLQNTRAQGLAGSRTVGNR